MQNGNAFHAYTEATAAALAGKKVIDYYQEEIPSETDAFFDDVLVRFMAARPTQRDAFQAILTREQLSLFGIYGHRAATRAVRVGSEELLLQGLVGAAVANYVVPERRRVEFGLAIYHHCARKLGLNPADLFTRAADYATADFVPLLVAFGNRSDILLDQFGWQERTDADGRIYYRFNWR